jgi:hypothetical protein
MQNEDIKILNMPWRLPGNQCPGRAAAAKKEGYPGLFIKMPEQ